MDQDESQEPEIEKPDLKAATTAVFNSPDSEKIENSKSRHLNKMLKTIKKQKVDKEARFEKEDKGL